MKRIYKLGNQFLELWHDEPKGCLSNAELAIWGIVLTLINLIAIFMVMK